MADTSKSTIGRVSNALPGAKTDSMTTFCLDISSSVPVGTHAGALDDADQYIQRHTARLIEQEESIEIGRIEFSLFRLEEACANNVNLFAMMDGETHSSSDLFMTILEKDGLLKAAVQNAIGIESPLLFSINIMLIEDIRILPEWRGLDLSLVAIERLQWLYANNYCLTTLKAFPIDAANDEPSDYYIRNGQKKLMKHYAKIGMRRVGKTAYMVKGSPDL